MATLVIKPAKGWIPLNLREMWRYRELFVFLGLRDIKVRYKQTVLGASWAIIQPLLTTTVFSVFFGGLGKIPSDGIPYPVFCYCGMLPWTYFSNSLSRGSASIVGNAHLISKIYFPRLIIPASMMVQPLIDFAISFGALICVMLYFHMTPPATAFVYIPLLTLLASALALAISLWLGALNVYYRDIAHIVPFLTQLWMFSSPIVFPYSLIPAKYQQIAALNPIVGLVEGFRSALLGRPWMVEPLLTSVGITLVLLASGAFFFRRLESDFADVA